MSRTEVKCGNPTCSYYRWSDAPCPQCGFFPRTATSARASYKDYSYVITSPSGAKSSPVPRFDLIPRNALVRLAGRYEKGLARYEKDNWRKGLLEKEYVLERLSHAVGHLYALMDQIEGHLPWTDDDHAAALMWAGAFACEATKALQENQIIQRDPTKAPPGME